MKRLIISTVALLACSIQFKRVNGFRDMRDFEKRPGCKVLGKGSFGMVEEVIDTKTEQKCALKHMNPNDHATDLEIKVAKQVEQMSYSMGTCPYIVRTLAYARGSKEVQTIMELADGGELLGLILDHKRLPEPLVKLFTIQLVLAIQCLHNRGILWLDGKPENTLLIFNQLRKQSGRLKIADFGLSQIVDPSYPFTTSTAGTTFYISPEVHAGKRRGYATDWWTLGIIVYEMLTGRVPFIPERSNGSDFVNNLIRYYEGKTAKVEFPSHVTAGPKELVRNLLRRYSETRLGVLKNGAESNANGVLNDPWLSSIEPDIGTMRVVGHVQDKTFDFSRFVKTQLESKGAKVLERHLTQQEFVVIKEERKKMQARLAKEAEDIEWKMNDELKGENAEANKLDPQRKEQIKKAEEALFNSLPKPQPGGQGVNNANLPAPKIEVRQPGGRIPPLGAPRFPNAREGNGAYAGTPAIQGVRYGQPLGGGVPRIRVLTPEELARKRAQDLEFEQRQMASERERQKARLQGRLNGGRERRPY